VFPVQSTNADKSFADAFGMLLANKYAKIASCATIAPSKSVKAIPSDGNLAAAAQALGADEYLEITAVGLYVSRKESHETYADSGSGSKQVIIIKENNGNGSEQEKSDRQLLDNSKTIVTVYRKNLAGREIYQTEMTLLTYGDIEESTERIALSLFQKLSIEKTRGMYNITRREGMGYNQLYAHRSKGFKMGLLKPVSKDTTFSTIVSLGFDYKVDLNRYYLEFGVGGRLPTGLAVDTVRNYGGNYFELGGGYYIADAPFGVFAGAGLIPFFNWGDINGSFLAVPLYVQIGISTPRNSSVRFFGDLRIAQNLIPVTTGSWTSSDYYSSGLKKRQDYPTEIGFEMGISW
ncbi:MAG TPA: hypothetical protein VF335_04600, partial [Chitinivibrionales bacterium]